MPAPAPVPVPGTIASAPRLTADGLASVPERRTRSTAARLDPGAIGSALHSRECARRLLAIRCRRPSRPLYPPPENCAQRARSRGGPRGGGRSFPDAPPLRQVVRGGVFRFEHARCVPPRPGATPARTSPIMPVFILRSSGLSIPNDGEWFTSKSVGLRATVEDDVSPESRLALVAISVARRAPGRNRVPAGVEIAYELERPTACRRVGRVRSPNPARLA